MGMYMKYRYGGWIDDIPEIPYTGASFTLNPVTSPTNNCFYMAFPGGNESLVFEYRKQDSDIFEEELPGSGLLIYRINASLHGNSDGPPDAVYIFRPNGSNTSNGQIAEAAFCAEEQRTEFNAFTNPRAVYSNGATIPVNIKEGLTRPHTACLLRSSPSPRPRDHLCQTNPLPFPQLSFRLWVPWTGWIFSWTEFCRDRSSHRPTP